MYEDKINRIDVAPKLVEFEAWPRIIQPTPNAMYVEIQKNTPKVLP